MCCRSDNFILFHFPFSILFPSTFSNILNTILLYYNTEPKEFDDTRFLSISISINIFFLYSVSQIFQHASIFLFFSCINDVVVDFKLHLKSNSLCEGFPNDIYMYFVVFIWMEKSNFYGYKDYENFSNITHHHSILKT